MDGEAWWGEARLGPWLEKSRWVTLPGIGICLALPPLLGFGNFSYVPVAGLVGLLAVSFALAEDRQIRGVFVGLWALSLFVVLAVFLLVFGVSRAVGGPFFGPDSAKFLNASLYLAREHFHLGAHPIQVFGSSEVGHYYLYALLIKAFHADVFAIQLFNCGITAIFGPLIFAAGRFIVPRFALLVGAIVGLNPELMMLAARDLLKDPSVTLTMTAAIWALVRVWRADSVRTRVANAAFAFLMVTYLRMGRFYVELYLAVAVAAVLLLVAIRRRPAVAAARAIAAAAISVFVSTEIAMVGLGWPSAPWLMYSQIQHVRKTARMAYYDPGLFDGGTTARSVPPSPAREASGRPPTPAAAGEAVAVPVFVVPPARPSAPAVAAERTSRVAVPQWAAWITNGIRRLYGPFIWIVPDRWDLREILTADYLLYPGMLIWYAVLPLAVVGLLLTLWRTLRGREESLPLMALCFFTAVYFIQYLAINLSYRQRATMFPVVLLFGFVGLSAALRVGTWKRWYASYWAALALAAVTHLAVRALDR